MKMISNWLKQVLMQMHATKDLFLEPYKLRKVRRGREEVNNMLLLASSGSGQLYIFSFHPQQSVPSQTVI